MQLSSFTSILSAALNAYSNENQPLVEGSFPILDLTSLSYLCFEGNGQPGYFYENVPSGWESTFSQPNSGNSDIAAIYPTSGGSYQIQGVQPQSGYWELEPTNSKGLLIYLDIAGNSDANWSFFSANGTELTVFRSINDGELAYFAYPGVDAPEGYVYAALGTVKGST